jgi:hypothetical protein
LSSIDKCGIGIHSVEEAGCGDFRQAIEMVKIAVADESGPEAVDSLIFEIGDNNT